MSQLCGRQSIKGGKSSVRECLQAFSPPFPPSLLSFSFFFVNFPPALYYLNAWNRLLTKQDFLAKAFHFLQCTLSMVKYSSRYLLFILYLMICFWIDWEHVYKYSTRKSRAWIPEKLHHCRKKRKQKKGDEHGTSFQSSLKINCTLNTRLICIQWKFTTLDELASPSAPLIEVLLMNILLFLDHWGIHLFQSDQHFWVIEVVDQHVPEKL